jgi:hypothetical protein
MPQGISRCCAVPREGLGLGVRQIAADREAVAGRDVVLRRIDPVATLKGHTNWVNAYAMTPDGRHVVSASFDQTIKV